MQVWSTVLSLNGEDSESPGCQDRQQQQCIFGSVVMMHACGVDVCLGTCVEAGGYLCEVGFLLPPFYRVWGSNPGTRLVGKAHLPAEPSRQPDG